MSAFAIILAGGTGERLGGPVPKQFCEIGGRSLLALCLERFEKHDAIDGIILVCTAANMPLAEKIVQAGAFHKVRPVIPGGQTRQESSFFGVQAVPQGVKNVLIHDAARALVPDAVISRVLEKLAGEKAVMAALPVADTVVRVDEAARVMAVLDRSKLELAQTPQGFRLEVIRQAHEMARAEGFTAASDDCSLVLRYNLAPIATVPGDPGNIKVTYAEDLKTAEALLTDRRGGASAPIIRLSWLI